MFELLGRQHGRPWAPPSVVALPSGKRLSATLIREQGQPVILRMQENRSPLGPSERRAVLLLAAELIALALLPALAGHWLASCYALTALGALTFALDRHRRSVPPAEYLEFSDERVCHHETDGQTTEFRSRSLRLRVEERHPLDCRLFLRQHGTSLEIGRCLAPEERRAMAPLIAAALGGRRESRA